MQRKLMAWLGLCVFVSISGCAMCNNCYDDAYNAYGGAIERQDRFHGRVGSILSDPGMRVSDSSEGPDAATDADLYPPALLEGPESEESSMEEPST
jgi:hypothetical protein